MRTNVVLDDGLVRRAMRCARARTKREVIDTALHEFVANHSRKDLRDLIGKVHFHPGYDYKALRIGH